MGKRDIPEINAGSMADIAFLLLVFFLVTTTIDHEKGQRAILPKKKDEDKPRPEPVPIPAQNLYRIYANKKDDLLIKNKVGNIDQIAEDIVEFYSTHTKTQMQGVFPVRKKVTKDLVTQTYTALVEKKEIYEETLDNYETDGRHINVLVKIEKEQAKLKLLNEIGVYYELPESAYIIFDSDKSTSYGFFIKVRDEIQKGIDLVRNAYCQKKWNLNYREIEILADGEDGITETKNRNRIEELRLLYPYRVIETDPKN